MFKIPKNDKKYSWTEHSFYKMRQYGISESRVKRIIRYPKRTEEGIAEGCIAVMQPAGTKRYSEIWVMYKLENGKKKLENRILNGGRFKIITTWRYPGKSSERDPVPKEIMEEIKTLF